VSTHHLNRHERQVGGRDRITSSGVPEAANRSQLVMGKALGDFGKCSKRRKSSAKRCIGDRACRRRDQPAKGLERRESTKATTMP